jgi:signal peptidase II
MNSMIRRSSRLLLILIILVSAVGCDQATKSIAKSTLASQSPISFLNDFVRLEYVENIGAFLSLGAGLSHGTRFILFVILSGAAVAGMLIYALRARRISRMQIVALALLAGGGIGNLIDRTFHGAVVDFMSIGTSTLRTGIFNVADMAVTAGVILMVLDLVPRKKREINSDPHLSGDEV